MDTDTDAQYPRKRRIPYLMWTAAVLTRAAFIGDIGRYTVHSGRGNDCLVVLH